MHNSLGQTRHPENVEEETEYGSKNTVEEERQ